jgi:lia operon protein LiaF
VLFRSSGQSQQWSSGQSSGWDHQANRTSQQPAYATMGKRKYEKFFGDVFIDCNGVELQHMEVSVFTGDVEIKLHGAILAPGLNRMIISGFIGDVRILVPPDMAVFTQASNFIGDSDLMGRRSSGFGSTLDAQTANYGAAERKLYIASNFFIGDIKVYIV